MDHAEGLETGTALYLPLPAGSSVSSWGLKAHCAVSSVPGEAPVLQLSSSDELDVVSIETGDVDEGCDSCRSQVKNRLAGRETGGSP